MATMNDNGKNGRSLPDGWELVTIGDVADTTSGGTPSRKYPEYFEGSIPWVKSGELGDGLVSVTEEKITETAIKNSSAKIFPAGSVLVALYGATVGKVGILNMDAASNQAVCALFPKNNSFTAKYMFYWLMSQRQDLINKSMGGAQPNISQGIVRAHPFPLSPIPEQERIVTRIEELLSDLDAGMAALERVRVGLKRYKASVLKAACEGKLFESREIENGELPEGWKWSSVAELAAKEKNSITDGPFGSKLKTEHYQESGPRVIRLQNIGDGEFRDEKAHISQEHFETLRKHQIFAGDLVIAGLGESLPRACIVPEYVGDAIVKADCIRFKPNPELAENKYLLYALNSETVKKLSAKIVHGIGRPRMNQQEIKAIPIPLPPLDEQRRIVAEVERRLSVVGEVESAVEVGLVRAGRLRQAILKHAFEGKLV